MKKLRRIISMAMVLVLFIGILPMNLGVVKAEYVLDDSTKIKKITARAYDGKKWENLTFTAVVFNNEKHEYDEFTSEFDSNITSYKIYLDPKYEKIQFNIKKNYEEQKIYADYTNNYYNIDNNGNGDIVTIKPGKSKLSIVTSDNSDSKKWNYVVNINKIGVGNIHELYVYSGSSEFTAAYEGDLVNILANNDTSGKRVFDKWVIEKDGEIIEVEQGNDIIKEPNKTPTEIRMPNFNLRVMPIYKESDGSNSNLRNIIFYGLEDEVWKNQKSQLVFKKEEKDYTVDLSENFSEGYLYFQFGDSIQSISATLNDKGIVSSKTYNGYETEKLALNSGENTFKITVNSEDGTNKTEYTLRVNRGEVKYNVSFDPGEGSGTMKAEKIVKGSKYKLPKCAFEAPENKEFAGWKIGEEIKDPGQEITIDKETLITATWKDVMVSVSFNPGDGKGSMDAEELVKGSKYNLPECKFEAPDGQVFKAWSVNDIEKAVGDEIIVNKDTEVIALWKDIMFKVSLVPGEGKGENIVKDFAKGSTYTLPDCTFTAPENKEFAGWEIGEEIKDPGEKITVNGETLITATWKDITFKISLIPGEGTGETIVKEVKKGTDYTLPDCKFTAPEGQVFKAWKIGDKEYEPKTTIKIDKETEIKAIWQENPDKPNPDKPKPSEKHAINITPSPCGEVIIDPLEAKAGDKVTVRAIAKYGYEFVGLSVRDASGELLPITNGEFIMPDCEVDIYPIFREIAPYINPKIYDKAEREEQKRRARRNYYYEEENNEDEVKTIDKAKEEKEKESKVLISIGDKKLDKINNGVHTVLNMDTKPYIKGGRTMLPLRYVAEALGYRVAWLSETRTAVIMDIGLRVEIPVDSNFIIVNGVKYTSDVKPEMRNNRIMLPIANIARALGLKDGKDILWDEVNRQVTLIRNFNTK